MKKIIPIFFLLLPFIGFCQNNTFNRNDGRDVWIITATFPHIGSFKFYASYEKNNSITIFQSFENRDKYILGGVKALMLRAMQKRGNNNSIISIELDSCFGKINSLFGSFHLKEVVEINGSFEGNIYDKSKDEKVGQIKGKNVTHPNNTYKFLANYLSIADTIIQTTASLIYDPGLVKSKKWTTFCKALQDKSGDIYDDVEFLTLFFANARNVGFSHFSLTKEFVHLERTIEEKQINSSLINDSVVILQVETLSGRKNEIDSVFGFYKHFKVIILDLRNTPGGNLSTTAHLASYLIQDTVDAGYFVTRNYFLKNASLQNLTNIEILKSDESSKIPLNGGHLILTPIDKNKIYTNRLFILVSKKTASACEPLVYGLKKNPSVEVIGAQTAGAILSPSVYSIGHNFFLIVPVAQYLTGEGMPLEGVGVTPTTIVNPAEALDFIVRRIVNK